MMTVTPLRAAMFLGLFLAAAVSVDEASADSPEIVGLFNTGVDPSGAPLTQGEPDPHYRLIASPDNQYGPESYRLSGSGFPVEGPWVPNSGSNESKWIAPAPDSSGGWFAPGLYDYEITFDLSEADLEAARIEGRWASDGGGAASGIFLNGHRVENSTGGFQEWNPFVIEDGFTGGENRLVFRADNPGTDPSPSGIRVEVNGEAIDRGPFPFFSSLGTDFDEPINRMWRIYGSVTDGSEAVVRFGNEPAYFEWVARKIMWSDEMDYRAGLVSRVRNYPISADGYVWSWGNRPDWPTSPGALHQENNAKYILSVYRIVAWTRDTGFLAETDSTETTAHDDSNHPAADVSEGKTILEKVRMAMDYQLNEIDGRNGLLVIDNDHNTGLPNGAPTNYWDNFPFGYKDAYSNVYFYASLLAMSELEAMLGNDAEAESYASLAGVTHRRFTEEFWDLDKRRFVGTVDVNGRAWDLGFTFLNTEALAYGLGDERQAEDILSWLDGDRIISSDTSTGSDIYAFRWAPRATTVDVATLGEPYWWKSIDNQITVGPGGNATYGEHLENGGAIFYTSHFDLMARAQRRHPDDAWLRLESIMEEFSVDELRRNPPNDVGHAWKFGIITVFPESGLVPASYLYAFLGIEATGRGLEVHPNLPGALQYGGVHRLSFGGGLYSVRVEPDQLEIMATHSGDHRLTGVFGNLEPGAAFRARVETSGGEIEETTQTADSAGEIPFDLTAPGGTTLRIEPGGE